MARVMFESSQRQWPSQEEPAAKSSSAVNEQQHREWLELTSTEQQQQPSIATPSTDPAQQHVGIESTGSSSTATFKMNTVSHRVVERT